MSSINPHFGVTCFLIDEKQRENPKVVEKPRMGSLLFLSVERDFVVAGRLFPFPLKQKLIVPFS
jgi:hypothetical protein